MWGSLNYSSETRTQNLILEQTSVRRLQVRQFWLFLLVCRC